GLKDRVVQLPVQAAFYANLQSVGSTLYYLRKGSKDAKTALQMFDLTQKKETALGQVHGYEISADHKKMFVSKDGSYAIIDLPKVPRVLTGLLGAQLQRDEDTGFYKITKILKGATWDPKLRSPLADLGVSVSAGEYIVAINGKATSDMTNPYEALVNKVGKQV